MVEVREAPEEPAPAAQSLSKERDANWPFVLVFIHIHLLSLYGLWLFFLETHLFTILFMVALISFGILGVTTGAHRLWAHGAYKATLGLRIFLMLLQTLAGQGSIYEWVRYHRLHHAHYGTDGDPYDYNRGFLHAHLLTRLQFLSPLQKKLLDEVDMSDLESDSVVMFQKRFYWILYGIFFILLPLNAPVEYWNDSVLSAIFVMGFLRYLFVLHASWLVESALCVWGLRPGEKCPPDSTSVFFINKTFWPHYHYLIPYDYKSGEYGTYDCGCSSAFIRVWAALGLAKDLRTVETSAIQQALAEYTNKQQPLKQCIDDAASKQTLPEDHYLRRK